MGITLFTASAFYPSKREIMIFTGKNVFKLKKTPWSSPRANYNDRVTAACRRSDCLLFADIGCHVVSVTDSYGRILGFLDRSRYFSIKYDYVYVMFYTHVHTA
jgi:hypothetical protein